MKNLAFILSVLIPALCLAEMTEIKFAENVSLYPIDVGTQCSNDQNRLLQTPQSRNTNDVNDLINNPLKQRTPMSSNYADEGCYKFIRRDGTLAEYGKIVVKEMERPEYKGFFYFHPQLAIDCPNYPHFSKTMKQDFFIHALAHLSWIESTCGRDPYGNKGETGLFQLENDRNINYRRTLAIAAVPEVRDACVAPIVKPENNIKCTMFNLAAQFRGRFTVKNYGKGAKPQPLLSGASSWGPIINSSTRRKEDKSAEPRGAYATLGNQVRSFPGCASSQAFEREKTKPKIPKKPERKKQAPASRGKKK